MTQVIAHRGASHDAPENTLRAFELALQQRADMIETDLHGLADGEIAVCHDPEIRGRALGELSLPALRELAPELPTLADVLDTLGSRIPFNLELKTGLKADYRGLESRVLEEVRQRNLLERTLFSSFREPILRRLRAAEPRARIGLLLEGRWLLRCVARANRLGAEAIHPPLEALSLERLRRWHSAGLAVRVYTVDDPGDQERLVAWGVDGLFTNLPRQLRALLDRRASGKP
jgi:glycerophosphoryl diester phosphodiesterase